MLLWLTAFSAFALVQGKVYERCELALELRDRFKFPEKQVATWVCIARHESEYNSSAVGGNTDHGLFQISDIYWCSPPGTGWACGVSCDKFEDDDISDDVECIRRIYNEHKRLSGDGFNAWTVYHQSCSEGRSSKYTEGCFDGKIITDKEEELTTEYNPENITC